MRVLSLDLGRNKTGVAISDKEFGLVKPLTPIKVQISISPDVWFQSLVDLLVGKKYILSEIDTVVVGSWKDSEYRNLEMKKLVKIAESVIKKYTIWDVVFIRETYTSIESRNILKGMGFKNKKIYNSLDSYAASLLLIDYLELVKPAQRQKNIKNI